MNADLPLSKTSLSKLDGVSSRAAWVEVSARRRAVARMLVLMCEVRRAPDCAAALDRGAVLVRLTTYSYLDPATDRCPRGANFAEIRSTSFDHLDRPSHASDPN